MAPIHAIALVLSVTVSGCFDIGSDWELDFGDCGFLDFRRPFVADDGREVGATSSLWPRHELWSAAEGHVIEGANGWQLQGAEEVWSGGDCYGPSYDFALDPGPNVLRWQRGDLEAEATVEARTAARLEMVSGDRDEAGVLRLEVGGGAAWLIPQLFDADGAPLVPPFRLEAWAADDIVTVDPQGFTVVYPEAAGETTVFVRVAGLTEMIDVVVEPAAGAGP